jgi:hypothetical protein
MDMTNTDLLDARPCWCRGRTERSGSRGSGQGAATAPAHRGVQGENSRRVRAAGQGRKGRPVAPREPVLVADFGVAQVTRPRRPRGAGQVVGSPEGRSPRSGVEAAPRREREAGRRFGQGPPCDRGAGKALRVVGATRHRQRDRTAGQPMADRAAIQTQRRRLAHQQPKRAVEYAQRAGITGEGPVLIVTGATVAARWVGAVTVLAVGWGGHERLLRQGSNRSRSRPYLLWRFSDATPATHV